MYAAGRLDPSAAVGVMGGVDCTERYSSYSHHFDRSAIARSGEI